MDPPFIVEFTDFRLVLEGAKVKTNFKKIDKLQQIQILGGAALHCLGNTSTCCALGQRGRIRGGDGKSLLIGIGQIICDRDDVEMIKTASKEENRKFKHHPGSLEAL